LLLYPDLNGLERGSGLLGLARLPWSVCWEYKILDLVKSLKVTLLNVAGECLSVLMNSAILSCEVNAIVLVGDCHLAGLQVILHDLGSLRVVLGRVALNLLGYLERAGVLNGLGNGVDLNRAGFVGLV
jgi:hypothetical protein